MTPPLAGQTDERLSFQTELSPSIIYRELERYHIDILYDPLACTTDAAGYFKLQNVRVIANDLALYIYVKGKALWENNHFTIPDNLSKRLADKDAKLPGLLHYVKLGGNWLVDDDRRWLEYWRREITEARDEYIRALAETAVCLVIDYWITARRFGTSSDWTPPQLLDYYIKHVSKSLLDNEKPNEMWRTDPLELTEKVIADVLFINPPPLKGYAAFGVREHTLESWLRGMGDFPLERIASPGTLGSAFDDVKDYMVCLSKLLQAAEHIPLWAFVLSNHQPFTRLEFEELMRALGRQTQEIDLKIADRFFSRRAVDTIVVATQ